MKSKSSNSPVATISLAPPKWQFFRMLENAVDLASQFIDVFGQKLGGNHQNRSVAASCPHACILPSTVDRKSSSSLCSWMGKASMSARRPIFLPGLPGYFHLLEVAVGRVTSTFSSFDISS